LIGLAQSSDPGKIEYTKLGEIIRCPWQAGNSISAPASPIATPSVSARGLIPSTSSRAPAWRREPYVAETIKVSVESDYVVVDL
jgi:hypothetical protein